MKEYFNRIDLMEIHDFVTNQVAEDLFLEFKTANYPQGVDFDKKNFSKCLSGFANSSGGILIWGISAKKTKNKPDVANKLKPINDIIEFENYLKKNEGNAVIPLIEGIEYRRILENGQCGYLLVYIPSSERSPHMGLFADKRYYKRSGDSFYICEHFDILDMINRKTTPRLTVELINESLILRKDIYGVEYVEYNGMLCIKNIGQVSAKHIVLTLEIKNNFRTSNYGLDGNGNKGMSKMTIKPQTPKYTGGSKLVLHPETFHEVDKIVLNEHFNNGMLCDLIIEYEIIAEGMKITRGRIEKKKEELLKLLSQ